MFHAIGSFCYRFRWIVIAVWVVLFGVSVVATPLSGRRAPGGLHQPRRPVASRRRPSSRRRSTRARPTYWSCSRATRCRRPARSSKRPSERHWSGLEAANIPHLESIQTYASTGSDLLLSEDGTQFGGGAQLLRAQPDGAEARSQQIKAALAGSELQTYVTGEPVVDEELTAYSFEDLRKVELYGLPVALIALIFVFGSLVSAALPVITGGLAVTVTLGGHVPDRPGHDMSIFAMNTATLLGLAVAIDYALFMVSRFREELHKGATVQEAVTVTTARAGRSVFFSGVAVMVGVVGLVFFPSPGSALARYRRRAGGVLLGGGVGHLPARAARGARPPGRQAAGDQTARSPRGPVCGDGGPTCSQDGHGPPSSWR